MGSLGNGNFLISVWWLSSDLSLKELHTSIVALEVVCVHNLYTDWLFSYMYIYMLSSLDS